MDTQKRYTTITSISLTGQEMQTLDEITKLEDRKGRSATVAFLIRFYSKKRVNEWDDLAPDLALKEAERLEQAATHYRMQAAADMENARREAVKKLAETNPAP